jgi:hypothetical protein
MKAFLLSTLLILPVLAFAQKTEKVKYVTATNDKIDFRMEIPNYMEATTELDADRPFQYQEYAREHYIIASYEELAIIEPLLNEMDNRTIPTLQKYAEYNWTILEENVAISSREDMIETRIAGMNARIYEFNGTVEGVTEPINYYAAFIEGKDNIYFILAWTLESEKETFRPIADKMIRSFRLK